MLDFEIGESPAAPTAEEEVAAANAGKQTGKTGGAGAAGLLAVLLLKGKSLLGLLKFGKIATTLASMALFIVADAKLFGWTLGIGIGVSILVHELGHIFVNWRKGLPCTAPMFIPFLGAVIFVKRFPDDPAIQAESGAGGPVAGGLAALVCLLIGWQTGSTFWLALANIGFFINLFNLAPFPPLDGSHMMQAVSPRQWGAILIAMLLWVLKVPLPMLWAVLLVGFIFRLGRTDGGRYLMAAPAVRIRIAVLYTVLAIGLATGAQATSDARHELVAQTRAVARQTVPGRSSALQSGRPAPTREAMLILSAVAVCTLSGIGLFLWLMVPLALSSASCRRVRARSFAPTAWMFAALAGSLLVATFSGAHAGGFLDLAAAYLASAVAALIYAVYEAVHRGNKAPKVYAALFARAFAWAAAGALLVAYATDDLAVAAGVLLCAVAFYARHRWMLYSAAASGWNSLSNDAAALDYRQRALARKPDPEAAAILLFDSAISHLRLSQGGPAVQALDGCSAALRAVPPEERNHPPIAIHRLLTARAEALALTGRHEESLACVEEILRSPEARLSQPARLLIAHVCLSQAARARGWFDEMQAQIDWCLRAAAKSATTLRALLHCNRAAALVGLGNPDGALAEATQASRLSRETVIDAAVRIARSSALLSLGRAAEAQQEASAALARRPGSLEAQYLHGMALRANGRADEGQAALRELAAKWPEEHWGRLASEATGSRA